MLLSDFCKAEQLNSWTAVKWTAVSEWIAYKTKTEWKRPTNHKNTMTLQTKNNLSHQFIFFTVFPILKTVFTWVTKKIINSKSFKFQEMKWTLEEHGGQHKVSGLGQI